jgi:hypothetical protein
LLPPFQVRCLLLLILITVSYHYNLELVPSIRCYV